MKTIKGPKNSSKKGFSAYTKQLYRDVRKDWMLYLILIPVIANFVIFHYIPIYGLQIAFKRYNIGLGIAGSPWVGFKNFVNFFTAYNCWRTIRNTIVISLYQIIIGFPMPILFALILNELSAMKFKKFAQTVSYLPHFISAVVIVGMIKQLLALSGPINTLIESFGGEAIYFLGEESMFRGIFVGMTIWQSMGFGAIIYLAAITGINPELYEAASIDGAGRVKRIMSITLPSILPTILILFIMRMGRILNISWTQLLLMQSSLNMEVSEVIGTFVYKRGIQNGDYSYASAVGLFNSVVGLVFVLGTNAIAKRLGDTSLF